MIVAIAQMSPRMGEVQVNAELARATIASAADCGAKLLVFPELSLVGYDLGGLADPASWVTGDDVRLDPIRLAAKESGVTTIVGAALRQDDGTKLLASLVLLPDGGMLVHGKRCLHGAERDLFQPGGPGLHLDVDGWRVALAVCYEAGVPAHAQDAADRGAEVYAVSALYTVEEERRFDIHLAARAMDHRMFALAANHAGAGPGWRSCGGSRVWHPDGRRVARAGADATVVTAALSRDELEALREKDAKAGYPRDIVKR